jgi:hypothetical protein
MKVMTTQPPDDRRAEAGWPVTVAIVLVVAVVAVVSILGLFFLGDADTSDADVATTVREYLVAFEDGDSAEACKLESATLRGTACVAGYDEQLAGIEDLEYEEVDIEDIEVEGENASALVSFTRHLDDSELACDDLDYMLVEEEDDWKINSREECADPAAE